MIYAVLRRRPAAVPAGCCWGPGAARRPVPLAAGAASGLEGYTERAQVANALPCRSLWSTSQKYVIASVLHAASCNSGQKPFVLITSALVAQFYKR